MQLLDYIILGLLLIGLILGILKGVKKRVSKLGGLIIGGVVAVLFYAILANFILNHIEASTTWASYWGDKIIAGREDLVEKAGLISPYSLIKDNPDTVYKMYEYAGFPSWISPFFISKIYVNDSSVANAVGSSIVGAITYACTFVGLFLVTSIVASLLIKFVLNGFSTKSKKGCVDRIVGGALSLFVTCVFIVIVMLILIGIGNVNEGVSNWLKEQVNINSTGFSISRTFYNFAWSIINMFHK